MTSKRFPADTTLQVATFLNSKKIDGELYGILQSLSYAVDGNTVVYKKDLLAAKILGEKLGMTDRSVRNHLNSLIELGYVIKESNGDLILPNKEEIYFMIPLKTLYYLVDNCREHILKIYIYLGQRYKYKGADYEFTLEEIGEHLGIGVKNNSAGYRIVNNALDILKRLGLIDYCEFQKRGVQKAHRLIKFNLEL